MRKEESGLVVGVLKGCGVVPYFLGVGYLMF